MLDFQSNSYNFPVEEQPVYTQEGELIPDHKCIVRTDTGKTLGLHGSRYRMIPHDDVVNSILDGVKASNLTSDYEVNVDIIEDGRKLRGEIIFPDLVQQPAVGDYVQFRVSFFNSYDGSWSFLSASQWAEAVLLEWMHDSRCYCKVTLQAHSVRQRTRERCQDHRWCRTFHGTQQAVAIMDANTIEQRSSRAVLSVNHLQGSNQATASDQDKREAT
jgi:hypothetical protein